MPDALENLLNNPSISQADADELTRRYPYFIYPSVAMLEQPLTPEKRAELKHRIAAYVGDVDVLLNLFGPDGDVFADFYPDMHAPEPSTTETIDAFLNKFTSGTALASDPLQFAPAVDYATIMEAEERGEQPMPPASSSGATAAKEPESDAAGDTGAEAAAEPHAVRAESAPLSESLAHLMIRNGNYSGALEILLQLNLNNPQKSVYFADQIRFLKKLIVNKEHHSN